MAVVITDGRVEVRSDPVWWRVVVRYLPLGAGWGVVIGLLRVLGDGEPAGEILVSLGVVAAIGDVPPGVMNAVSWWLRPRRVRLVVQDGVLSVHRGRRELQRFAAGVVVRVEATDPLTWRGLLVWNWFGFSGPLDEAVFVAVEVDVGDRDDPLDGRHVLAQPLLWGERSVREAERALRGALALTEPGGPAG